MIISRTPFRISFFGGGTDYPAWYREHGGAVLSTTIDKHCYIMVRELPPFFPFKYRIAYSKVEHTNSIEEIEHPAIRAVLQEMKITEGLEIHIAADLPSRSGIGSSSTFVVGLIHALRALKGQFSTPELLATESIRIEQKILMENVGSQDQTAAAYGGLNYIQFPKIGIPKVMPLEISPFKINDLTDHLMLFFTGITRRASDVAKFQIDNIKIRQQELFRIKAMAEKASQILIQDTNIEEFGLLLNEAWEYKKKLSDQISSSKIDAIYQRSVLAGAIGGKLIGAGQGGFMLFFVPPNKRNIVKAQLSDLIEIQFTFSRLGSSIITTTI